MEVIMRMYEERKSAVQVLSETYGWPLKIKRDGYTAYLADVQPLNDGERPMPIYRFPGGDKVVDDSNLKPAE